jgi:hypothetical protein
MRWALVTFVITTVSVAPQTLEQKMTEVLARERRSGSEVPPVTYATVSAGRSQTKPVHDSFSVETMFRFLGVDVRVLSANVGLVQHWAAVYSAFRVPPGPAAVTVRVHGPAEGPPVPGQVTLEGDGMLRTWRGNEAILPPLAMPPLNRWVYLHGVVVGRAGQAVLVVGGPGAGLTLLAMSVVAQGAWVLADGMVPLDPGDLLLAPFPKAIRLRREALTLLAIDQAHPALTPFRTQAGTVEWRADPRALLGSRAARVPAGPGAIVFLNPTARTGQPHLEPLRPEQALLRLLGHLHQPPVDPEATEKALTKLCRQVLSYTLRAGQPAATARLVHEVLLT